MTEQIEVAVENEIYSVFIVIALHEENTPFWNLNALAHLGKSNDIDFIKVLKERKLKKLRTDFGLHHVCLFLALESKARVQLLEQLEQA